MAEWRKTIDSASRGAGRILQDVRVTSSGRRLRRDLTDTYRFYIEPAERQRLDAMGRLRRWCTATAWLLRGLVRKLTPTRRVMLIVSVVLLATSSDTSSGALRSGFLILLFLVMLELKDKLVAYDELAAGRQVQLALLPAEAPRFDGWDLWFYTRPANEVGGDLVDYLEVDEDTLGLALADVAGKGLGAAVFMAKLQATLRALAPRLDTPAQLGEELNEIICGGRVPDRFASLVYLELERGSGVVRALNAGHPPPILLSVGRLTEQARGGPALGILPDAEYTEQTFELDADETLVVYSDGVTDACDEQGEFFGQERLLELLAELQGESAEDLGHAVLDEVRGFVGGAQMSDDLSLLVVRRAAPA